MRVTSHGTSLKNIDSDEKLINLFHSETVLWDVNNSNFMNLGVKAAARHGSVI